MSAPLLSSDAENDSRNPLKPKIISNSAIIVEGRWYSHHPSKRKGYEGCDLVEYELGPRGNHHLRKFHAKATFSHRLTSPEGRKSSYFS